MSKAQIGHTPWNKGLKGEDNPQTGKKKPPLHGEHTRQAKIGFKWYNNGTEEKQVKGEPPEGWVRGRLK